MDSLRRKPSLFPIRIWIVAFIKTAKESLITVLIGVASGGCATGHCCCGA